MKPIAEKLITWFRANQRDLPWRKHYKPYEVWISEIMLQQTQVTTVLPYFARWMKALPTVKSLAEADEQAVLKLWEGLGYYSRARNLRKAAQMMMLEHGGKVPADHKALLKLPGIGPYTAGAIASIAYEQDYPVVDGNVVRVLARLNDFRGNTCAPGNVKHFWAKASELVPKGQAREFNQAIMEFGALMCTPKSPKCGECPLTTDCKGLLNNTQDRLPNKGPKSQKFDIQVAIAVIHKEGKVFIQRRPNKGLMAGLWEFPGGQVEKNESPEQALHREIQEELNIRIKNVKPILNIRHAYTRYLVDLHCYQADYADGELQLNAAQDSSWVELSELSDYPFPAANVRLIQRLQAH